MMSLDVNISEPDEFNCVELHTAIEKVAIIKDISDFSYHVDYLNGSGFIANIFRVILKEHGTDKNVSVIVKTLINTDRKDLFRELHNREVKAYSDVIDRFRILQDEIEESRRIVLPKCIYCSSEKGNEVLIFEDLIADGFEINDAFVKKEKLEFSQVSLIFSELAKFHGLSYVFEKNDKNLYNELAEEFKDLLFQYSFLDKSKLRDYFTDSFQTSLDVLNDLEIKKTLEMVKPELLKLFQNFMKPKEHNVFCHGDFWLNNILFKDMGTEKQICFLDFQTMRHTNPVTDMTYFLYICTDSHFRSEYQDTLLNIYYESLKCFLELFNIEDDKIFTLDKLKKDYEEHKVLGLLIALVGMRIVVPATDENLTAAAKSFSEIDLTNIPEEDNDNLFSLRINDVVKECYENGVLNKLISAVASVV